MHLVGDLHRLRRADLADADGPDGREPIADEDRADQARQVVLVADRGEHLVDSLVGLDRRLAARPRLFFLAFRLETGPNAVPDQNASPSAASLENSLDG